MPYRFTPGVPSEPYPPQRPPLGSPRRGFDALGCSVIAVVAGVAAAFLILTWFGGDGGGNPEVAYMPDAQPRPIAARGELAGDERDTIRLFQQTSPSVVHINTSAVRPDRMSFNLLEVPLGAGSGFLWDDKGHVVTNYHVLEAGNRWQVMLADHTSWNAVAVGGIPDQDIAVLKIDAPKDRMRPLLVGSSSDLQVGQTVFAIGNPFGLDQTLTKGIISGLGREIPARTGDGTSRTIQNVIQTDAAINPGNSGGPLLDSAGRLIGMNTAIYSPSGVYAGVGFAIPVDTINRIVPKILRTGVVARADIGATFAPDAVLRDLELPGALIVNVPPGSAAERAGLQPTVRTASGAIRLGDIVTAVEETPVSDVNDLLAAIDQYDPGDTVKLSILRGAPGRSARREEVSVTLQSTR
jgi:S1-C subfamily serine protease